MLSGAAGAGNTSHAAREPQSPVRNWLVQDKQNHRCMEKAAVYSCGSNVNVDGCRQGSQGCLHLLPALLTGTEAAARCKWLLRLHVVAGGHRYKRGHMSDRGPGHPPLAPGEASSASQMQHGRRRGPEPAVPGKPVSLHGSGHQVELLILML